MSNERTQENAPEKAREEIRDGRLKATLWHNQGKHGPYVTVDFARTYTDKDGNPRDSHNFRLSEIPNLLELGREARTRGLEIERDGRKERARSQEPSR